MVSIEECVRIEECSMSDYIKRTCIDGDTTLNTLLKDKTAIEIKNDKSVERTDGWKKRLYMANTSERWRT